MGEIGEIPSEIKDEVEQEDTKLTPEGSIPNPDNPEHRVNDVTKEVQEISSKVASLGFDEESTAHDRWDEQRTQIIATDDRDTLDRIMFSWNNEPSKPVDDNNGFKQLGFKPFSARKTEPSSDNSKWQIALDEEGEQIRDILVSLPDSVLTPETREKLLDYKKSLRDEKGELIRPEYTNVDNVPLDEIAAAPGMYMEITDLTTPDAVHIAVTSTRLREMLSGTAGDQESSS